MTPDAVRAAPRGRLGAAAAYVSARARLFAYAAFALLVFVIALLRTLPHDLIARRALEVALAAAPVEVAFRSVAFAFPNGYRFADVRVSPVRGGEALASLSELTVRMPLTAIVTFDFRQAAFAGRAYGGDFDGKVRLAGARVVGALDARSVSLEPALAPLVPPPGRLAGVADLSLRLSGDGRTTQSAEGEIELSARDVALDQVSVRGFRLPDLALGTVAGSAQIFGARLQLKELRAAGNDLTFAATGDVLLREPVVQSVLNLRLTIDVPPDAQPALRVATALLPKRAAGETPSYTLKGTIGTPVLR
ncbi:MAG: type II secretion system protein GspN [Thermodesulfobacteriota bacterium]